MHRSSHTRSHDRLERFQWVALFATILLTFGAYSLFVHAQDVGASQETQLTSTFGLWLDEFSGVVVDELAKTLRKRLIWERLIDKRTEKAGEKLIDAVSKADELQDLFVPFSKHIKAPWVSGGFISHVCAGLEERATYLRRFKSDDSWRSRLEPQTFSADDIIASTPVFVSSLRESVDYLLATRRQYEAVLRKLEEKQSLALGYRKGLRSYQTDVLEKIMVHEIVGWEWWNADQAASKLSNILESLKRLDQEYRIILRTVEAEYSVRSKVLDLLEINREHKEHIAELDKQLADRKRRATAASGEIDTKRKEASRLRSSITEQEGVRDTNQKLAARPYICPISGVPYSECQNADHQRFRDAYNADKQEFSRRVANATSSIQAFQSQLSRVDAETRELSRSLVVLQSEIEGIGNARKKDQEDCEKEISSTYQSVRAGNSAESEALNRQLADARRKDRTTELTSVIRQESVKVFFRRMAEVKNLETSTAPSGERNPFVPGKKLDEDGSGQDLRNPFNTNPPDHDSRNPFEDKRSGHDSRNPYGQKSGTANGGGTADRRNPFDK